MPDQIPIAVWILGKRYGIVRRRMFENRPITFAHIDCAACLILLPEHGHHDADDQWWRETLLHEIIHGIDRALTEPSVYERGTGRLLVEDGVSMAARGHKGGGFRLREDVVKCWSEGLFSVLTDPRNALVVRYIVGDKQMCLFGEI